ncbi:MAG: hypothetical protein K5765_09315 [Clostridia bacterium]|nr:hypothetical protein [Clostridia bacterium]
MSKSEVINNKIVFFLDTKGVVSATQKIFIDLSLNMFKTGFDVLYVNNTHIRDLDDNPELINIFRDINSVDYNELDGAIFFVPINYLMHLLVRIRMLKNVKICLYMYHESAIKWLCTNTKNHLSENLMCNIIEDTQSCAFINELSMPGLLKDRVDNAIIIPYSLFKSKEWFNDSKFDSKCTDINCINIGYFGNIYTGIAPSINNIMANLAKCKLKEKIIMHLIGDTSTIPNINLNGISEAGASLVLTGKLSEKDKIEYARKNIDIAFAINYDAVNIAASSTPTLIPIIDSKPFLGNRYVWINDVINLDFSWSNISLLYKNYNCYTMEYIINQIIHKNQKESIGEAMKKFVFEHCSIELAKTKLLELVACSKLDLDYLLDLQEIKGLLHLYSEYGKEDGYDNFLNWLKTRNNKQAVVKTANNPKPSIKSLTKNFLKKALPHVYYVYKNKKFLNVQKSYKHKIIDIRKSFEEKKQIKVGFLVLFSSVFPARPVFEKMCQMKEFDPYIIVIPNVSGTLKKQRDLFNETYDDLLKEYGSSRIIKAYDISKDTYLDIKDEYSILFFSNPYKVLVHKYHEIEYFLDKTVLPIYVSYGFAALSFWEEVVAMDFYNYLWKASIETQMTLEHLKQIQRLKGKNGVVTGYIKADGIASVVPTQRTRKRILICPHHTVWGWKNLNISNFLKYAEFFIELPKLYPNIDFVFRPHPLLIPNLKEHCGWTQKQVDDYLARLLENPNMSYDTSGDYYQQFVDSDAMIHDCGSFIAEYLYTGNPCCYMMKSKEETYEGLIPFGKKCMDQYYYAFNQKDIIDFIDNVIILNIDPKKGQREQFVNDEIKINYPHATESLIEIIKKTIIKK